MPQLGSRASSGRAWQLQAARHSQEEAGPLGAQPLPLVLELVASKAADFTAFDHAGPPRVGAPVVAPVVPRAWASRRPTVRGATVETAAGLVWIESRLSFAVSSLQTHRQHNASL